MRASMDSSFGGLGGMGMGGMSGNMMYGMMGMGMGNGGFGGGGSGMADFGTQIRPVTYTPPAIAMTPHFGMFQVQQSLAQAGLASMGGPFGAGVGGAFTNFMNGGFRGLATGRGAIPEGVTTADYMAMSARGFGDRVGDASAIGAATAGSTIAGLGLGGVGAAAGASLFSGGFGAAMGGFVGGMVPAMMIQQYTGAVTDMMAENRSVQSSLASGSFRFLTGSGPEVDPLTGRGMSRRTRANVASSIQGMELGDLRYGMDEYRQILEGGMQFDMFSGTHDVDDFKSKFKGLVENLKTVTSTLHTSLKEGIEVIRGFRDMGVTDPGQINNLTLSSEARGRMSGRTGLEMISIGQSGAEIFRGTGINMERGFELNQMNATSVRGMLNSGTLTREMVAQAGGENALAQQMTAGALSAFQTSHGRAAMMANFNPATGTMNPDMINGLAGGGIMSQISRASGMGPAGLLAFQAHQEELIGNMSPQSMQLFGLALDTGTARMLRQAAPGLGFEDALRVAGQNRGLSRPQIEAQLGLLHQDPEKMRADQDSAMGNMRMQAGLEDVRNRFNIGKRISNAFRSTLVNPVAQGLIGLSTGIGESIDNLALRLGGAAIVDPTLTSKELVTRGEGLIAGGMATGAIDTGGSMYQNMIGGQSGRALVNQVAEEGTANKDGSISFNGVKFRQFDNMSEAISAGKAAHTQFNVAKASNGKYIGASTADLHKLTDTARGLQPTADERDKANHLTLNDKVGVSLAGLGESATLASSLSKIFGDDGPSQQDLTSMDDKSFQKKYKNSKGSFVAQAERYFNQYQFSPEAVKQFKNMTNSSKFTDDLGRAREVNASTAGAAAANLLLDLENEVVGTHSGGLLTGAGGSRSIVELARGDKRILSILGDSSRSAAEQEAGIAKLTGFSGAGLHEIVTKMRGEGDKSVRRNSLSSTLSAFAARSNEDALAATGGTGVATGKTVGDISQETVKIIEAQSSQLLANYKQLIALQEKLGGLLKGNK